MTEVLDLLAAEFPREAIHWRSQSLTRDGTKAMALAYIDARDVMDRLDMACGPGNWQDEYCETAKGRVICRLSIRLGDEWIVKSDGAGDTAVEGEKGGLSNAFKRAAVKWGVGRYLYDMPAPWVPCESYEKGGKRYWKKWTEDPWKYVNRREPAPAEPKRPAVITDDQRGQIISLQRTSGVNTGDLLAWATKQAGHPVKDLRDIPASLYQPTLNKLNATIESKKEKEPA